MFRVIEFFTDLQDGNHSYNVGDTFPRESVTVTADRIKELSGTQNKRGIALIEEVREAAETVDAEESADKSVSVENEPRKRTRKRKTEE